MKRFVIHLSLAVFFAMSFPCTAGATQQAELQNKLQALAKRASPGLFGITVLDLQTGQTWSVNADRSYPMMSVFKAPVAAAVLGRIEHGQNTMDQTVTLHRSELESGTIHDHFQGKNMTFTVGVLLTYAVSKSDNSAVDALIRFVGGPSTIEHYLRAHGIEGMRVDRDEAGNTRLFNALASGETLPPDKTPIQQHRRLLRGYRIFMSDPGNRSTPDAAAAFLRKLWRNELLSPASTQHLLSLMYGQSVPSRLRTGLPAGVRLADKCGTSDTVDGWTAAYNDIGIVTWPNGHAVIIAAFLTGSNASEAERLRLYTDLARDVTAATHP
ncbi:class A beta-lactamase [Dyella humi]|uniref:Beta-lactamase n=1 Tax=Dyella humi TaxID=1770547 RepID=A0ABW8IHX2_9GAMM